MKVIEKEFIESFRAVMEQRDFSDSMDPDELEAVLADMNDDFGFDCIYDEGLFKAVLIPINKGLEVVIKFDKRACSIWSVAVESGVKNELNMSKKLEARGFGDMIAKAKVIPYATDNDRMLSFQERATVFRNFHGDLSYTEKDITVPLSRSYDKINRKTFNAPPFAWYMKAVQYHGYRKVVALFKTLIENGIRDFHKGNVGFIGDRPVLIDYGY